MGADRSTHFPRGVGWNFQAMHLPRPLSTIGRVLRRATPLTVVATLLLSGAVGPAPSAAPDPILDARQRALDVRTARPGYEQAVKTGIPTQMVGFEWEGNTDGAVEVRARQGDAWGPWTLAEGDPDEGPDRDSKEFRGRTTAGPVWVGDGVEQVEVRVTEGDLDGLTLHAIRSEDRRPARGVRPAGAAVAKPGIVSRAAWGADESFRRLAPGCTGRAEYADSVRYSVVHHTATSNAYGPADSPAIVRGIYYFHTHTNKWCDIGYNFLVDRFGRVFEGRAGGVNAAVVGAHASGFNRQSTGAAVIGTFSTDAVPDAAMSGLQQLLDWKLALHRVNPTGQVTVGGRTIPTVAGHRDVNATECPGQMLQDRLVGIRQKAAQAQLPDRVTSVASDKVLDVAGGSTLAGAGILQWSWHGAANQQWRVVAVADDAYEILSVRSGMAVDVAGGSTADGAGIVQWPRHGGRNQQWRVEPLEDGTVRVVSVISGKVLDLAAGAAAEGAPIVQWTWHGGPNQRWQLSPVG